MACDYTKMLKEYIKSATHDQPVSQRRGLYRASLIHSCMYVKYVDEQ